MVLTQDDYGIVAEAFDCDPEEIADGTVRVTLTRDPSWSFVEQHGSPDVSWAGHLIWYRVQTRPGARRGKLIVVDLVDFRAVKFDGEA